MSATSAFPVYRGKFGAAEAERLLWRARRGPARRLLRSAHDAVDRSLRAWCSIADHRARGVEARLVVKKKRR